MEAVALILGETSDYQSESPRDDHGGEAEAVPRELNGNVGTSIQITNTMIGSGILTFPYVLANVGIVLGVVYVLFFGWAVYLTSIMLIDMGKKRGILDYSAVVEAEFGFTVARVLNVSIALTNFGALMSYFNTIGTLGSSVVSQWDNIWLLDSYAGFMVVFAIIIEVPIIMLRSYGELTFISFWSLSFIIVVISVVGVEGQLESSQFYTPNWWPNQWVDCVKYLGNFSYALSCQSVVFEAYASMTSQAKQSWNKTILTSVAIGGVLLTSMAILGYGAFGQQCESDILANFNVSNGVAQAAMLITAFHLLLYIPNDFIIMRLFALRAFGVHALTTSTRTHVAWTLLLFAVPLTIMAVIPTDDVAGVFSLIIDLTGDIPSGFSCFFLPAVLYLSVFEKERGPMWYAAGPIAAMGLVLCVVCPFVDIWSFAEACSSQDGCSSY